MTPRCLLSLISAMALIGCVGNRGTPNPQRLSVSCGAAAGTNDGARLAIAPYRLCLTADWAPYRSLGIAGGSNFGGWTTGADTLDYSLGPFATDNSPGASPTVPPDTINGLAVTLTRLTSPDGHYNCRASYAGLVLTGHGRAQPDICRQVAQTVRLAPN